MSFGNYYWIGPYGCLVLSSIHETVAKDGGNILREDGYMTERGVTKYITKKEYLLKYCEKRDDLWFYIGKH
jgi:hypothetical protein